MSTSETQSASIKELHRSRSERILAGVAGGLGRYFDISATFFRIGFVDSDARRRRGHPALRRRLVRDPRRGRGRLDRVRSPPTPPRPALAPGRRRPGRDRARLAVRAGRLLAQQRRRLGATAARRAGDHVAQRRPKDGTRPDDPATPAATPAATPVPRPRQPSLLLPGLGVLLAAVGALALLDAVGVDVPWDVALAVGAIGTGVAVVAGVALRRRTGGLVVVGLVLAALAVAVSAVDVRLEGPIGTRIYSPVKTSDLKTRLRHLGRRSQARPQQSGARGRRHGGRCECRNRRAQGDRPRRRRPRGRRFCVGRRGDRLRPQRVRRRRGSLREHPHAGSDRTLRIDAHVGLGDVIVETP